MGSRRLFEVQREGLGHPLHSRQRVTGGDGPETELALVSCGTMSGPSDGPNHPSAMPNTTFISRKKSESI